VTSKGKKGGRLEKLFGELAKLSDPASRKEFLARHRQLCRADVVEQLDDAVSKHLRVNLQEARALAEATLEIAQQIGDPKVLARGLRAKANALWFIGENKSAAELHEQSVKLFRESGATLEVGRTLSVSIQPLILLGDYERAFVVAEQAREIFKSLGEAVRLARLEINIGNIFHRQDRFAEAIDCYERAYQGLIPDKDKEGIAASLHNLAVCLISLNDFRRALTAYECVREFCDRQGMPLAVAQADYNIAYLYYLRGEYSRAIEMLRATRASCEAIGDAYHQALCDLDLSEIYLELNLSEEAAETAQEALAQFRQLKMGYEAAKSLANLAIALSQQEKGFRALDYFTQARAMFLQEKNLVWPSLIDLYQALVFYNEGRLFEARRLSAKALEFFGSSMLQSKAILCRLLLARLSLRTGELEAARRECQTSLQQSDQLDSTVLKYQSNFLMGQVEETARNPQAAYGYYQVARESLEALRSSIRRDELKIAFMKNRVEVYENLVGLCLSGDSSQASAEEALSYMEQAKSRTLRDLIFGQGHPLPSSAPTQSELVRRIGNLREELNWYYHRIEHEQLRQSERAPEHIEQLQAQARQRERDFLRALREVPTSEAKDSGLETADTVALDTIRSTLTPACILLEYFRVRDRIVVALLTRDSLDIVPVTLASRLGNLLRMFQFQLSKFRLDPGYVRGFGETLLKTTQAHLRDLYNELLEPVRQQLNRRHLIIVPHDILHYLPFHALYDGERYLIDAFTVSYAPSASIYALCHRGAANRAGISLVLGVPDPGTPYIFEEVQSVAGILPQPELFLGAGASESVLREKGPLSRIVHIATHGHFRKDNPMFSGIRLGGSYLNLYDLYSLKLPVELVTLSGCATGVNVVAAGDELLGLVRGLLYAGAQSLLLTLWDVQDKSTSEFMKSFYRHYGENSDKSLALQSSMHELRERYPHPYYWAPFILVGRALSS
jgi:CHAT domain-containing protein